MLKDRFKILIKDILPAENSLCDTAIDNVYEEMVRKLCNIRIQEFCPHRSKDLPRKKEKLLPRDKTGEILC